MFRAPRWWKRSKRRRPVGRAARVLSLDAGAFALAGIPVGLAAGRYLSLDAGAFTLAGPAVGLAAGRYLSLDAGAFTLAGIPVGFLYSYSTYPGTLALRRMRVLPQAIRRMAVSSVARARMATLSAQIRRLTYRDPGDVS